MDDFLQKSIIELAGGGFIERLDYETPGVIRNLLDPNTPFKPKRKMILTFEFSIDESRRNLAINYTVKPVLVPTKTLTTFLQVYDEENIVEMVPQIPGQQALYGAEQENPVKLKIVKFA